MTNTRFIAAAVLLVVALVGLSPKTVWATINPRPLQKLVNQIAQISFVRSVRLVDQNTTLRIAVTNAWFQAPAYEQRQAVTYFAGALAQARKEAGYSNASYVFVEIRDQVGKVVASYSAWSGVKLSP